MDRLHEFRYVSSRPDFSRFISPSLRSCFVRSSLLLLPARTEKAKERANAAAAAAALTVLRAPPPLPAASHSSLSLFVLLSKDSQQCERGAADRDLVSNSAISCPDTTLKMDNAAVSEYKLISVCQMRSIHLLRHNIF